MISKKVKNRRKGRDAAVDGLGVKIVQLLQLCEGAHDLSFIIQAFPRCDAQEISAAVLELCLQGTAVAGVSGIELVLAPGGDSDVSRSQDSPQPGDLLGFQAEASKQSSRSSNSEDAVIGLADPKAFEEPVCAEDDVADLSLSARPLNALSAAGVSSVSQLVEMLPKLPEIPGLGGSSLAEVRTSLDERALSFPFTASCKQAEALMDISRSSQYVFDAFGVLCRADRLWFDRCGTAEEDDSETLPLEALGLPVPLTRRLKCHGLHTVRQVAALNEKQLLSLRGIGAGKVAQIKRALESASCRDIKELRVGIGERGPFDRHAHLASFSREAKGLSLALQSRCRELGYPVHEPVFEVCVLPAIQENLQAEVPEEAITASILEALESSPHLSAYCRKRLHASVDRYRRELEDGHAGNRLPIPSGRVWRQSAQELSRSAKDFSFDPSCGSLEMAYPSVIEWMQTLPAGKREIVRMRLSGLTLEACGIELGVTRERVRQIVKGALNKRPPLSEDRYRYLFDTYEVSEKEFIGFSHEPAEVYHYLKEVSSTSKTSKLPLQNALEDPALPDEMADGIREMILRTEFVCEDGAYVRTDRRSITEYLVKRYATDRELPLDELKRHYDAFLSRHPTIGGRKPGEDLRALKAYLERCDFVMKAGVPGSPIGRDRIRYYDAGAKDFSALEDLLSSGRFGSVECSTALLLADSEVGRIMEELDIRNEYELHYAIGRFCSNIRGVKPGRTPIILFGQANRNDQILSLIKELGPVDAHGLADEYERRYGVKNATFRGSFLKGFEPLCKEGLYDFKSEGLSDEEREFLSDELAACGDFLSVRYLEERFEQRFPGRFSVLLSKDGIEPCGYRRSGSLLFRSGIDEKTLFAHLIKSREELSVDDPALGHEVFAHDAFRSELEKAKRAFEVIEFERGRYARSSRFEGLAGGMSPHDFRSYLDCATAFMEQDVPYTVKKLRSAGFHHRLDALENEGYGACLFESVLSMGYVGGRLRRTSIGNVMVVCKTSRPFSTTTLIEYIIEIHGAQDIAALAARLQTEYGIEMGLALLRSVVQRSKCRFDKQSDRVSSEA